MPYNAQQVKLFQCAKHGGCKGAHIKPGAAAKMLTHQKASAAHALRKKPGKGR